MSRGSRSTPDFPRDVRDKAFTASSARGPSAASRVSRLPLAWLGALLVLYLCAPFVASIPQFAQADWHNVDWNTLGSATAVSAGSATLSALLVSLTGIPLAYWLARRRDRISATIGFIVQLPLAMPPLTSGVLLLFLLGPYSLLGNLTNGALTDSFIGVLLAATFVSAPFLIVAARSAFSAVDPVLEDVGATLGRRPTARFFTISLPLAWPAIRAGLLLSWLRAFGEFGATVMVAYHPYSLPVYTYVAFGSTGLPTMLPIIAPTFAVSLLAALLVAGNAAWRPDRRPPRARRKHPGKTRAAAQTLDGTARTVEPALPATRGAPDTPAASTTPLDPAAAFIGNDGARTASAAGHTGAIDPSIPAAVVDEGGVPPVAVVPASDKAREPLAFAFDTRIGTFSLAVSWSPQAKRLAIIGESGSGKSMTLRLLAGLAQTGRRDTARFTLGSTQLASIPAEDRHIAFVPQDFGLFPHMTVAQQWGYAADADWSLAQSWSRRLALTHLEQRFPAELSIGQRQRVSIVRALSRNCRLILLDEPFSALDTPRRRALRQSLRELQHEIEATTVLVTHDPDEAAQLADEVLVLDQGRVLQAGTTLDVFARPANPAVAALLGLSNVGSGTLDVKGRIDIGNGVRLKAPFEQLRGMDAGAEMMWRIDPDAVRRVYGADGHAAFIEDIVLEDGQPRLLVSVGEARLKLRPRSWRAAAGLTIRIDFDHDALTVWPQTHATRDKARSS